MKLRDLNPRWAGLLNVDEHARVLGEIHDPAEPRRGLGITFDCPHCLSLNAPTVAPTTGTSSPGFAVVADTYAPTVAPATGTSGPGIQRLGVFFTNPLDGGAPYEGADRTWQRNGTTFDDLSITPSIDVSAVGHWHGYITNGEAI